MAGPIAYLDDAGVGSPLYVSSANPLPVAASITPGGTQDVNLTQTGGVAVARGHGTAATALRVELPTDGTGVVGLNAGSAIVGKVGIDQTTPGTTNGVTLTGDSYSHITTATTTTVKNSPGTVKKIVVNSLGTVASTITLKDNATTIAIIDSLSTTGRTGTYDYNIACATSIVVVTTGTVAPDITVTYQ